jgi:hypothetical protein
MEGETNFLTKERKRKMSGKRKACEWKTLKGSKKKELPSRQFAGFLLRVLVFHSFGSSWMMTRREAREAFSGGPFIFGQRHQCQTPLGLMRRRLLEWRTEDEEEKRESREVLALVAGVERV